MFQNTSTIDGAPTLSVYDRNILRDMLEIFEPFEEATDCAQRQNTVYASLIIRCIRGLRFYLDHMESKYNCTLGTRLKQSVEKRLMKYEDRKVYVLATILDPRFKLDWCKDEEEKELKKTQLTKAAQPKEITQNTGVDSDTKTPVPETSSKEGPHSKRKWLFSFMHTPKQPSSCTSEMVQSVNTQKSTVT